MKKKILLIQPENQDIRRFRKWQLNNFVQATIPYLAAYIDESIYQITLADEYNQKIPYHQHFDLVAITVNTPNAMHCYQMARKFHETGAKVAMGGPHATLMPHEVAEHCDFLLTGECEDTWPLFLREFYQDIPQKIYTPVSPPTLQNLPHPRWDLVRSRNRTMKAAVIATRGCPYHCRYCNLKQIYFDICRTRPVAEVIRAIEAMPSKFFVFWDDNLFGNKAYAMELLQGMKPLRKRWAAQVTLADCAHPGLLQAARDAGCLYLFVGLESFSSGAMEDAGKPVNKVDEYKKLIGDIHAHKILVQSGVVFGFDSDTRDVFAQTLAACEALGIDGATVSLLTPLPQTPIYRQFKEEGRLLTQDWAHYNGKTHVAFVPKNMTPDELFEGYMAFRKKFYSLRSFWKRMRVSRTHLLYNFYINLGYRLALKKPGKRG